MLSRVTNTFFVENILCESHSSTVPPAVIGELNERAEAQHEEATATQDPVQAIADAAQRVLNNINRARLLKELARNPPPNELVRPIRVPTTDPPPTDESRQKRDRQPPKHFNDFEVNLFHSKKGK
jgi:hypothetical protein